ncbi:MAG: serine/threonine protein kinase [Myxococcaceae bacterium]|nr:serine/threonine protein kinase [Myxococcaceae bacterium]
MSSVSGLVGARVGEFEVLRRIGVGGMGAVYEGRHPLIGKRVSVKVLHAHLADQPGVVDRFIAEARAVNEIRHRGIVDIFSFGQLEDGSHYFIMELLEGQSFEQLLQQRGPLPPVEALSYFAEVLDAVGAAHEAKIIHRDLKPSNLFLVQGPRGKPFVKVLDFGIAKLQVKGGVTRTKGGVMGTPAYMAPEQVLGGPVGPETDLYALGAVLFEMLSGRTPFTSEDPLVMMRQQVMEQPPTLSSLVRGLPPEIDALVSRMLRKKPEERPRSCDEVLRQIQSRLARTPTLPGDHSGAEEEVAPTVVRKSDPAMKAAVAPELLVADPRRRPPDIVTEPEQIAVTRVAPLTGETSAVVPLPAEMTRVSDAGRRRPVGSGEATVVDGRHRLPATDPVVEATAQGARLEPARLGARYALGALAMVALGVAAAFLWPDGNRRRGENEGDDGGEVAVADAGPATLADAGRPDAGSTVADGGARGIDAGTPGRDAGSAAVLVPSRPGADAGTATVKQPVPTPRPQLTRELLDGRLRAAERKLKSIEKQTGDVDNIIHSFLNTAKAQVAKASSPSELKDALKTVEELERQIAGR